MNKSIQELKSVVMHEFAKQNSKVGHSIDARRINAISQNLNPKERDLLEGAINELIEEGLIEYQEGGHFRFVLKLQERGYDAIYPESDQTYIENVKRFVFSKMRKSQLRVGNILAYQVLNSDLHQSLNAKELGLFNSAIESLVTEGYVSISNSRGLSELKLEQKGYDVLY